MISLPLSIVGMAGMLFLTGDNINIMSLAGIAISIGVLVDGAIVEVENAYNRLYHWQAAGRVGDFHTVRLEALKEVGPSVFFSLLIIIAAYIPLFTLERVERRLFTPMAFTVCYALLGSMLIASLNLFSAKYFSPLPQV
jgi:Cu(I)/Ag(I) efflux system membrane protein CusA/SilA